MKIVLSESQIKKIVDEALKDEIPNYMQNIINRRHANVPNIMYTDIPKHTDKIPNVKIEIEDEKIESKIRFDITNTFTKNIINQFDFSKLGKAITNNRPLLDLIVDSLDAAYCLLLASTSKPTFMQRESPMLIDMIAKLYSKEFRLPTRESHDIRNTVFSKNKSGIATFLKVSSKLFPELKDLDVEGIINDRTFVGLREPIINYHVNLKKLVGDAKLYLYISDKPDDKLRMSISRYYDSCQNMYSGGDEGTPFNRKLLSNVFDANSKVAYLIYNVPFRDNKGNEHPYTSIARTIIRVGKDDKIMFDSVYPNNMEETLYDIIEDKTGLVNKGEEGDTYVYSGMTGLPEPYMDMYNLKNVGTVSGNERIEALVKYLKVNPNKYEFTIGDDVNTVICTDNNWGIETMYKVFPEEEMEEKCRDYMIRYVSDYFDDKSVTDMENMGLLPLNAITKAIGKYDKDYEDVYQNGEHIEFDEYLEEHHDVKTLKDFEEWCLNGSFSPIDDLQDWYFRNLDVNKAIKYIGFQQIARDIMNNSNFDVEYTDSRSLIFRPDSYSDAFYIFKVKNKRR